jgi:hypothetical protein
LYGNGTTNPSQNLVDAFPMVDGNPAPAAKINGSDPFSGRDPRLDMFILHNGSNIPLGSGAIIINTVEGSQDALGSTDNDATKTGYYLRKFMNTVDVDLDPKVESQGLHYYTYARYTDVLLMFAEAANEAVGPDGDIGGYSARQVINAIRERAGILTPLYVALMADLTDMIRNERRLELCFEKQRFWDLRRWKLTDKMNEDIRGVRVSADGSTFTYETVEPRQFDAYQIYGPIPYNETLKYDMVQNEGW